MLHGLCKQWAIVGSTSLWEHYAFQGALYSGSMLYPREPICPGEHSLPIGGLHLLLLCHDGHLAPVLCGNDKIAAGQSHSPILIYSVGEIVANTIHPQNYFRIQPNQTRKNQKEKSQELEVYLTPASWKEKPPNSELPAKANTFTAIYVSQSTHIK